MKPLSIVYSPEAQHYIRRLHPSVKSALRNIIEELFENPLKGKALREEFEGFRSHRFKKYRVIYQYEENKKQIEILFAGPRIEVYRLFAEYLKKMKS